MGTSLRTGLRRARRHTPQGRSKANQSIADVLAGGTAEFARGPSARRPSSRDSEANEGSDCRRGNERPCR